jgi:NAD+ kinase
MIHAIGLVVHAGKPAAVAAAESVREWSRTHGITCTDIDVWTVNGSNGRLDAAEEATRADQPELIVTVGGDGTFLRGVRVAAVIDALVLGIDVGRVGYLTETPVPDLEAALDAMLAGEFTVDERLLLTMCASRPLEIPPGLETFLRFGRGPMLPPPTPRSRVSEDPNNGVPLDILALNDVVFERLSREGQTNVAVFVDGRLLASYSADAVIVSTPTGSTAYSFAAGGPVLSPRMDALIFTPVAPHMAFNRSLVVGAQERVAVQVLPHAGQVQVAVDGALRGVLEPGDWVSVYAAAPRARLARLHEMDFLGRLRDRLGLGDAPAALADGSGPDGA